MNTKQTGTAHKLGHFNAFATDFDLKVNVQGNSESTLGYTYGLTYGTVWKKEGRKLNPGFEIDLFNTASTHESKLTNPLNEEVANLVGPNGVSVVKFVDEHYGAGLHKFANAMKINSWNAAANFTLSYDLLAKVSINGALGLGFAAVSLKEAESFQESPASPNSIYETSGGSPVNHFNNQPDASNNLMIFKYRLGAKIKLSNKVALQIDARGISQEIGDFNFGSTNYIDHAPTDNWKYSINGGTSYQLTTGLCLTL
jgi:opacity protein-like surface antigen